MKPSQQDVGILKNATKHSAMNSYGSSSEMMYIEKHQKTKSSKKAQKQQSNINS